MGRGDVLVLCYHAVSPTWPTEMAVRPGELARQLECLLGAGYTAATFSDAVLDPPAAKTFAVTFDDGYRSVLEHGVPVLGDLAVPATIFVSTNVIDAQPRIFDGKIHRPFVGTPYERELLALEWSELRDLADAGWQVGSHTLNHPRLTQVDDARLERELTGSRARLEEVLDRPCLTLAYPSGDHDARVVAAAGRAGYSAACTLPARFPRPPRPLAWPRVLVTRSDDLRRFRLKTARVVRDVRTRPVWPLLDAARDGLGRLRA